MEYFHCIRSVVYRGLVIALIITPICKGLGVQDFPTSLCFVYLTFKCLSNPNPDPTPILIPNPKPGVNKFPMQYCS